MRRPVLRAPNHPFLALATLLAGAELVLPSTPACRARADHIARASAG